MTQLKLGNVVLDECLKCGGIWFDKDELEKARDEVDPDLRWMDFEIWGGQAVFEINEKPHECPRCRKASMKSINYRKPDIDVTFCPLCEGMWLNAGDFKDIIGALSGEAGNKSVSDYVKASLKEASDIFKNPKGIISEWKDLKAVVRLLRYRIFVENPKMRSILVGIQKSLPL
jgi:Zn-finger nucleic acid-binding protein